MQPHPATKFKGLRPNIIINNPQTEMIGKRSGLVIKTDTTSGFDFILQDPFPMKSNCTTNKTKAKDKTLHNSFDDSSSSSSSSSSSDNESLSLLSSEKEGLSNNEAKSIKLATGSHSNAAEGPINIKQCAENILCATNYDNEDSKLIAYSKNSRSYSSQQNDSSVLSSQPRFKTKEEIERKYQQTEAKSNFTERAEADAITIQGMSSIQKGSNSIDNNSLMEESNVIKAIMDEPKRGIKLNKTIYEETEEELTKNCLSQTIIKERTVKEENELAQGNFSVKINEGSSNDDINHDISSFLKTSRNVISDDSEPTMNTQLSQTKSDISKAKEKALRRRDKEKKSQDSPHFFNQKITKRKKKTAEKSLISETQYLKQSYQILSTLKQNVFDVSRSGTQMTFGLNNRYSLRTRVPRLNHLMGERIKYIRTEQGDEISQIISSRIHFMTYQNSFQIAERPPKLYKPLKQLKKDCDEKKESNSTTLIIKPNSKMNEMKNASQDLTCEVSSSKGNNWLIINDKIYKNQKTGKRLTIPQNAVYEFRNYSNNELILVLHK